MQFVSEKKTNTDNAEQSCSHSPSKVISIFFVMYQHTYIYFCTNCVTKFIIMYLLPFLDRNRTVGLCRYQLQWDVAKIDRITKSVVKNMEITVGSSVLTD